MRVWVVVMAYHFGVNFGFVSNSLHFLKYCYAFGSIQFRTTGVFGIACSPNNALQRISNSSGTHNKNVNVNIEYNITTPSKEKMWKQKKEEKEEENKTNS